MTQRGKLDLRLLLVTSAEVNVLVAKIPNDSRTVSTFDSGTSSNL